MQQQDLSGGLHGRFRHGAVALCGLLLATAVHGGPRDQPATLPTDKPDSTAVEPATWIKRLVGRFRIEGIIHHEETVDFDPYQDSPDGEVVGNQMRIPASEWDQSVQGKGDCTNIGGGPGLQCWVNMVWPETWSATGKAQLGGVSNLTPAGALVGLTPTHMPDGITFLLVDDKGLPHPGSLTLRGESAGAKPPCVNLAALQCAQVFKISAKADSDTLFMELRISTRFRRDKSDRKPVLDYVPNVSPRRFEKPSEFVDELLHISFTLKRLPPDDSKPVSAQIARP